MTFMEFWRHNINEQETKAIEILEHQILTLDKEWRKYEKRNFTDWNVKFKGLTINQITPRMQIPMRDANIEKKEFSLLWTKTSELFNKTVRLISKGKTEDGIILLFSNLKDFEEAARKLESEERETVTYLRKYSSLFKPLFDNNYGEGYFEKEVLENYEIRFRILEILINEFDLIRYLLSDII